MITCEKFESGPSRNHSWKYQVSPVVIDPPGGFGRAVGTSKPVPDREVPEMLVMTLPSAVNLHMELSSGSPRFVALVGL